MLFSFSNVKATRKNTLIIQKKSKITLEHRKSLQNHGDIT